MARKHKMYGHGLLVKSDLDRIIKSFYAIELFVIQVQFNSR